MADKRPLWESDPEAAFAEASRRVEQAKIEGEDSLDFSVLRALERLPTALSGLTKLTWLYLYGTQVTDISPLAGLTGLQRLYFYGPQVTDISPLAGLTGLQKLDLNGPQVTDISPLVGLTGLQELDLRETQVTDISPLSGLTGLQRLNLRETQVTDISPLSGLTRLQRLNLNGTEVTDLRPLRGLVQLANTNVFFSLRFKDSLATQEDAKLAKIAAIKDNKKRVEALFAYLDTLPPWPEPLEEEDAKERWEKEPVAAFEEARRRVEKASAKDEEFLDLSDLRALKRLPPALSNLKGLQRFHLKGTQVTDISPLSALTGLQELYLRGTQVADISPLSGLTRLQVLSLGETQVSDISPLSGLTGLESLDLDRTQITNISPLSGLERLQELYLEGAQVANISPLSVLMGLERLHLEKMQITDISPLSGLTRLQLLNLSRTQVADISPLSGLTGLVSLDLSRTQVTDIGTLLGFTGLQGLALSRTQVSDISSLLNLIELAWLNLNGTQVKDLRPLRGLTKLAQEARFFGLHFEDSLATKKDAELAKIATIKSNKERFEALFAYLDTLSSWPEPLEEEKDEALDKITAPEQLPSGNRAGVKADGRIGFVAQPLDELSPQAKAHLQELIAELEELIALCQSKNDNTTPFLTEILQNYCEALRPQEGLLDAGLIFRSAKKLRREDRIEQENIRREKAGDQRAEPKYKPDIGAGLHDLVGDHNIFALVVPSLAEKDRAALDPALQLKAGMKEAALKLIEAMVQSDMGFDPEIAELKEDLDKDDPENEPLKRDQRFSVASVYNAVTAHLVRVWRETRREVKALAETPEAKQMFWDTMSGTASAAVIYAIASPVVAPVIPYIFLIRNEEIILKFLALHPVGDLPADLIKRHNILLKKTKMLWDKKVETPKKDENREGADDKDQ